MGRQTNGGLTAQLPTADPVWPTLPASHATPRSLLATPSSTLLPATASVAVLPASSTLMQLLAVYVTLTVQSAPLQLELALLAKLATSYSQRTSYVFLPVWLATTPILSVLAAHSAPPLVLLVPLPVQLVSPVRLPTIC